MMPPYTYAAGRMAEERRRDIVRRKGQPLLYQPASPAARGSLLGRLLARIGRPAVPGDRRKRPDEAPVVRPARLV